MSLRDVTIVRDETGDRVRGTSRTGSARRFVGDLKKVRELETGHQTRRFDFCELTEAGEFAPYGCRTR